MGDEGDSRVRWNTVYLFAGVVVANLSSFLFRVVLAREFGPEGFGVFSLALMVTSVAAMIAHLGLPDGVVTFVSKFSERGKHDRVAGVTITSLVISFSVAIVLSVVVVLTAPLLSTAVFDSPELAEVLWWFAWVVPANVLIDTSAAYFLGVERGWYNTVIKQIVPKVLLLTFVLVVVFLNGPLVAVGAAYLLATVVAALFGLGTVVVNLPTATLSRSSFDLRRLLTYSFPLLATSAIGTLSVWTDTLVVGYFRGSAAVGVYQSAYLLAMNLHVFLGAISGALYPNFGSLLTSGDANIARRRFIDGTRWAVLITIAPATYLIGFSTVSLGQLFGPAFEAASGPLSILVISQGLIALFGPATNFLKAAEETRYIAVTHGIAALANLVLNVALVPVAGLLGAAVATALTSFLGNTVHFWRVRSYVDIRPPLDPLVRALTAGLLAYLPASFASEYVTSTPGFVGHIALFSVLYVILLGVVGGYRISEVRSALSNVSEIA